MEFSLRNESKSLSYNYGCALVVLGSVKKILT